MLHRSDHRGHSRHYGRLVLRHLRTCHQWDVRHLGAGSGPERAESQRRERTANSLAGQLVGESRPCWDVMGSPSGGSWGQLDASLDRSVVVDVAPQEAVESDDP